MEAQRNRYVLLPRDVRSDLKPSDIDPFQPHNEEWGIDYYIEVFAEIERTQFLSGMTFYLSYVTPVDLPEYGSHVVLVIVGDETFKMKPYFSKIGAILRCYGATPAYIDGLPVRSLQRTALLHFAYKMFGHLASVRSPLSLKAWRDDFANKKKTLHIPLGTFGNFNPKPKPIRDRSIDYAFLGSLAFDSAQRKWQHRLFQSPKILSRRQMIEGLNTVSGNARAKILATGDFEVSIQNKDDYVETLANTKISLVPRGTSVETYRFYESLKAGCVIVCERLPNTWFYDGHPGIVIEDWRDLANLLPALLADQAALEQRAAEGLKFYRTRYSQTVVAKDISNFLAPGH